MGAYLTFVGRNTSTYVYMHNSTTSFEHRVWLTIFIVRFLFCICGNSRRIQRYAVKRLVFLDRLKGVMARRLATRCKLLHLKAAFRTHLAPRAQFAFEFTFLRH